MSQSQTKGGRRGTFHLSADGKRTWGYYLFQTLKSEKNSTGQVLFCFNHTEGTLQCHGKWGLGKGHFFPDVWEEQGHLSQRPLLKSQLCLPANISWVKWLTSPPAVPRSQQEGKHSVGITSLRSEYSCCPFLPGILRQPCWSAGLFYFTGCWSPVKLSHPEFLLPRGYALQKRMCVCASPRF